MASSRARVRARATTRTKVRKRTRAKVRTMTGGSAAEEAAARATEGPRKGQRMESGKGRSKKTVRTRARGKAEKGQVQGQE